MVYIAKGRILHNEAAYKPGDQIAEITRNEAKRLIDLDVAFENEQAEAETKVIPESKGNKPATSYVSVEAFTDMKAQEQKKTLQECGVAPESSAEKRVHQYTEWLSRKENEHHESL
ncbi:hypothetical protein [Brevibacillus nitrificans]|uniref:hypothetical protein n=1 Tax=Brevibacillus nitrificans TaxID=651560 RepID=UPI002862A24F|nr:hypothetical protein [Brevibacillus nitrificans]MDR7318910.1 hypothetical protein [Brevibacillus nitrificans]